jgi:hypothetical protein
LKAWREKRQCAHRMSEVVRNFISETCIVELLCRHSQKLDWKSFYPLGAYDMVLNPMAWF